MGRTPEYDRDDALTKAAALFGSLGYAGCSIEELVQGTGVHRGSLYKAFGSKRGLFIAALRHHMAGPLRTVAQQLAGLDCGGSAETLAAHASELDLLLVAAIEAGHDPDVEAQLKAALTAIGGPGSSDVECRTAGLLLLCCRLAWHATTPDELPRHLRFLSFEERRNHGQGSGHR